MGVTKLLRLGPLAIGEAGGTSEMLGPAVLLLWGGALMKAQQPEFILASLHLECDPRSRTSLVPPSQRPIWPGHCLLSRLELDHGTLQLPGALQMKESSKHNNKGKLGRRIPREGGNGASTEHIQTLQS